MFYTECLFLRQVDPEADTKVLLKWFNDPDSAREIQPPGPTMPKSRESIRKMIVSLADKEDKLPFFIVCDKPDAKSMPKNLDHDDDFFMDNGKPRYPAVGLLSIGNSRNYSPINRTVMLGIILDEQHQNRGLGTELMTWALSFIFDNLGMHRIELGAASDNARALHLYEKVGFVREGLRRKCAWRDGEWRDAVDLAILEDEWRERQTTSVAKR